jgi:hypothetical protein
MIMKGMYSHRKGKGEVGKELGGGGGGMGGVFFGG